VALAHALLHGVRVALAMGTDRVFVLGAILLTVAFVTLFFLPEIALKKKVGDFNEGANPQLNGRSARAILGLALAERVGRGGFRSEDERETAKVIAATLLSQYVTDSQEIISPAAAETAATTNPGII